jgi:hypothetical protein
VCRKNTTPLDGNRFNRFYGFVRPGLYFLWNDPSRIRHFDDFGMGVRRFLSFIMDIR